MKTITFFTAIVFLMLSSCRKESISSSQQQSLAKEATTIAEDQTLAQTQSQTNASTSGGAVTFSEIIEIPPMPGGQLYNPCTNEIIYGTSKGSKRLLFTIHGVINGNKSTITIHANVQGATAVGASGREYVVSGSFNRQESSFSDGVFTTKLEHFDRWVTAGRDNNLIHKETYYIKVDADGNVTVIRDETNEWYCQ